MTQFYSESDYYDDMAEEEAYRYETEYVDWLDQQYSVWADEQAQREYDEMYARGEVDEEGNPVYAEDNEDEYR